ncbi:MAG: DUF72 domain-containing protein [Calditrichia bacterium]
MIKIGCCGYPVAREKYFAEFQVVEIQKTFYQLPQLTTAEKWHQQAPKNFEFTLKAWQGITHLANSPTYRKIRLAIAEDRLKHLGHFQPTEEVYTAWNQTLKVAEILQATVIILQCSPRFIETEENLKHLAHFFQTIPRNNFKIALEFRGRWRPQTILDICQQFRLTHCVDPFKEECRFGEIRYYRLHGSPPGERMYRYQYNQQDFKFLAEKIRNDAQNDREIYCMFNNITMWDDARSFRNYLNAPGG